MNRRFVGFQCEGPDIPPVRTAAFLQGRDVGYVTSAVFSPGIGKAIALGFVNRVAAEPGTRVDLVGQGSTQPAKVVALPFIMGSAD